MARFSDFTNEVRPVAQEAAMPTIEAEIRRSAIELCRESQIWRAEVSVSLVANQAEYNLLAPGGGRADNVLKGLYVDDDNQQHTMQKVPHDDYAYGLPATIASATPPRHFSVLPSLGRIRLYPAPDDVTANPRISFYTTVVPTRRSRSIPDFLAEKHWDAIVNGAKWRLLMIPDKPWSNPQMAEYHRRRFYTGVNQARREAMTEQWAPASVKLRRWV